MDARQALLAELHARDADLEVDAITLDFLDAHGLPAAELLRRVWKEQCVNLDIEQDGADRHFSISASDGRVSSSMSLGNGAFWNGEKAWFRTDIPLEQLRALVGSPAAAIIKHPAFAKPKIATIEAGHAETVEATFENPSLLFDQASGRLWREEWKAA